MAASRDSAAMRVIAASTTVILPATFTAVRNKAAKILMSTDVRQTFFSTTSFDFQANSDPSIVSWWLWLYFVVTVSLSIVIFLWWNISLRRKEQAVDGLLKNELRDKA